MQKASERVGLEEALPERRKPSAIARFFKAVSYGPFGAVAPPMIGFILGTLAFLLRDAFMPEHNVVIELPLLLMLAVGAAVAFLAGAIAANYLIGRRILEDVELQAKIHAGEAVLVPTARAELPGIDLLVRSRTAAADSPALGSRRSEARTKEARTEESRTREVA